MHGMPATSTAAAAIYGRAAACGENPAITPAAAGLQRQQRAVVVANQGHAGGRCASMCGRSTAPMALTTRNSRSAPRFATIRSSRMPPDSVVNSV